MFALKKYLRGKKKDPLHFDFLYYFFLSKFLLQAILFSQEESNFNQREYRYTSKYPATQWHLMYCKVRISSTIYSYSLLSSSTTSSGVGRCFSIWWRGDSLAQPDPLPATRGRVKVKNYGGLEPSPPPSQFPLLLFFPELSQLFPLLHGVSSPPLSISPAPESPCLSSLARSNLYQSLRGGKRGDRKQQVT